MNTRSQGSKASILDTRGRDRFLEDVIERKHLETAAVYHRYKRQEEREH